MKQLGDKYILLDLLGIGGVAEVYRSKLVGEAGFSKMVVVKKLLSQFSQDEESRIAFINEARLAALLQHENIASTYDFGEIDGEYFIAMEHLAGVDLFSLLQKHRENGTKIAPEFVLPIVSKICAGMDYAHKLNGLSGEPLNIIHRDLTPHNIFVTWEGKVKILDFGIAKAELADHRTRAGVVKGKVSYMSPEQLAGEELDCRSDLFSIAILCYELLSGKRMYQGDNAALIRKCFTAEYTPLPDVVEGLPEELYEIVHTALSKEVGARFKDCKIFKEQIEDCYFTHYGRMDEVLLAEHLQSLFVDKYQEALHQAKELKSSKVSTFDKTVAIPQSELENSFADVDVNPTQMPASDKKQKILAGVVALVVLIISAGFLLNYSFNKGKTETIPYLAYEKKKDKDSVNEINRKEKIEKLFSLAMKAIEKKRLTQPNNESAYYYYQQILALEPDNNLALDGVKNIVDKVSERVDAALSKQDFAKARRYLERGLSISPESSRLLSQQKRLAQNRLAGLEKKANLAFEENRLTTPKRNNAFYYFRELDKAGGHSKVVQDGYKKIADRYYALASRAHRGMSVDKARVYVTNGLKVMPDHAGLLEVQKDLQRSTPGVFFSSLGRSLGELFSPTE